MSMTDEQIIMTLEYCVSTKFCEECPICNTDNCGFVLMRNAFDLIERQQAEIEEQDKAILNALKRMGEVRAEAVREFAKRLTEHSSFCVAKSDGKELYETKAYTIRAKIIDELVREMTEEKK